jgi:diaminohydroxyphosphoribosylaminopyrimidine deaminase / 5-amino-6-(5-phosphoribosylamino)uracil reductase
MAASPVQGQRDREWMLRAIELSRQCPPSPSAFSVGAIVVGADGTELARGYSRESDPHDHAEESALAKVAAGDPRLRSATLYSTLEPCSERRSHPVPCAQLAIQSGIGRVVIAWREPSLLVADCQGVELLKDAGIEVIELPELADAARAVNQHIVKDSAEEP